MGIRKKTRKTGYLKKNGSKKGRRNRIQNTTKKYEVKWNEERTGYD